MTALPCCHCERSEAIPGRVGQSDGDCFVAVLLAMTSVAWVSSRRGAESSQAAALPAGAVEIARIEPGLKRGAQCRPFGVDDREPRRVAVVAAGDHSLPEQAFIREPEPRGGSTARQVQRIAFPLVAAEAELLENAAHRAIPRFRCRRLALQGATEVQRADLDRAVGGLHVRISAHPNRLAAGLVDNRMEQPRLVGAGTLDPFAVVAERRERAIIVIGPVAPLAVLGTGLE